MVWLCDCGCHVGVCTGEDCECEAHVLDPLSNSQIIDLIVKHSSNTKQNLQKLTRNKLYKTVRHIECYGGDPELLLKEAQKFVTAVGKLTHVNSSMDDLVSRL